MADNHGLDRLVYRSLVVAATALPMAGWAVANARTAQAASFEEDFCATKLGCYGGARMCGVSVTPTGTKDCYKN